jgi:hydrogenase maturation factor
MVAGTMLGEAPRERMVSASHARPGDAVILVGGLAIEGTAILAREAADALRARGVPEDVVEAARRLLFAPGISVVDAARAAVDGPVHAMHDPTEGGLATALHELAEAAGVGIEIDRDEVPVLPETEAVCTALGLDPLGLLASGALLVTVPQEEAGGLTDRLGRGGIASNQIGRVTAPEVGTIMRTQRGRVPIPQFARDELARWFDEAARAK